MAESTALVLSSDFDAILARREAQVAACEHVDRTLREQPEGFPRLFFSDGREWDVKKATREADRAAWSELVAGTGLYSFMDATARRQWAEQLDKGVLLPFTAENARAFVEKLHGERGDMVKRGVGDCFRRLSGHYATNLPDRFGARMILTHVLTVYGSGKAAWWSLNSRTCDDLDDLVRVLRLCRQQIEPDHRQGVYQQMRGADNGSGEWPRVVDLEFFTVKVHKNGNGHLTFKYEADVLRLNKILSMESGGLAIAPSERAVERRRAPAVDPGGDLAFFATPPGLALELVERCGVQAGDICLEPSAGEGAIAEHLIEACGVAKHVLCVELHEDRARTMAGLGVDVHVADFLQWDADGEKFDRIVMNPPFSLPGNQRADIDHVERALELLAPGGRLVAVMSAGVMLRRGDEFRAMIERRGGMIEELPEGSFADSGTRVRAVVVTVDG